MGKRKEFRKIKQEREKDTSEVKYNRKIRKKEEEEEIMTRRRDKRNEGGKESTQR